MKISILIYFSFFCLISCSKRIGDLTVLANRNVEFSEKHVLIKRNVKSKSTRLVLFNIRFGNPNFEEAIDQVIKKEGAGEYFRNVEVHIFRDWYILFGTWGFKIRGDLYGYDGQITKSEVRKVAQVTQQEQKIDKLLKMKEEKRVARLNIEQKKKIEQNILTERFNIGDKVLCELAYKKFIDAIVIGKEDKEATVKCSDGKIIKLYFSKLTCLE